MPKTRQHNEYFRPVSLGNRKSCPECHCKLTSGEFVWSWGEYHNAKWRTVTHFCQACFASRVQTRLTQQAAKCGCEFNLVPYHCVLPHWLVLGESQCRTS